MYKASLETFLSQRKHRPKKNHTAPLLFALDAELSIPEGFIYELDCKGLKDQGYCAGHIGCGGGSDGGSDGCGGVCGGG